MQTQNNSTTQNRAPSAPREAHQQTCWEIQNQKAMDFLTSQANRDDQYGYGWQAGRFFGGCEALCMAGVITAEQWQELQELENSNRK
ncbi:MAG: hypothetical protein PHE17_20900 [Thiothrix sp.]|uniref:hypothetical protein n=1 Tax=Thiothrix sp. TaxID=1032 RepID=UPI0026063B08|nr:hypothetical protein [Thiothrix sp.]MDD5395490.1 hypothetical protein [Thiothrix sp.]